MTSSILWSVSVRAICKQGLVQSRARGVLVTQTETSSRQIRASDPHHQSVAAEPLAGNWIASVPPFGWRKLRARVDRVRTIVAIREPAFLQGDAGTGVLGKAICAGPSITAGKCFSFLRSLVQHPEKSGRSVTHGFGLAPVHVLSSIASCHGKHHDSRSIGNGQNPLGEVRNVVR